MGLFSWFAETGRKSAAAAHIQQYFEASMASGVFKGDPMKVANEITEHACAKAPQLQRKVKGYVLAAAVLVVAVRDNDLPVYARDHFAMALEAMLETAQRQDGNTSADDLAVFDSARTTLDIFRQKVPTMSAVTGQLKAAYVGNL